uniref:Uncharacterized protein n=1 Tax=Chromera velia CCMP2878 TaxID=1169474 RepID=A0A0G4G809_9ALVE|eukprot:Cvel_4294.t1-p1 / transcript=Cvel_4294.t1 / gene=Cvel_4294 / organism=Chromera_velia_CCMP2878 / gene_product=hypothetical protein / transcript_product=hypothetical protein / location=Cvel_scaffold186:66894-72984(-) / protein_length=695 / sequence_SO=supercontig / SO=protein_coding / is_pseudo=false
MIFIYEKWTSRRTEKWTSQLFPKMLPLTADFPWFHPQKEGFRSSHQEEGSDQEKEESAYGSRESKVKSKTQCACAVVVGSCQGTCALGARNSTAMMKAGRISGFEPGERSLRIPFPLFNFGKARRPKPRGPSACHGPLRARLCRLLLESSVGGRGTDRGKGPDGDLEGQLRVLSFAGCGMGGEDLAEILSLLPLFLQTLDVKGNDLRGGAMTAFRSKLSESNSLTVSSLPVSLRVLILDDCSITCEALEGLSATFKEGKMRKLVVLSLSDNPFETSPGFSALCCAFEEEKALEALEVLRVRSSRINSKGVKAFAEVFAQGRLPSLREVDFGRDKYQLGYSLVVCGAIALADATRTVRSVLPQMTRLHTIDLIGRDIQQKGIQAFLEVYQQQNQREQGGEAGKGLCEDLRLCTSSLSDVQAKTICSGGLPCLKALEVHRGAMNAVLEVVESSPGPGHLRVPALHLIEMVAVSAGTLGAMTRCLRGPSLSACLRQLHLNKMPYNQTPLPSSQVVREFFVSLSSAHLETLSTLFLNGLGVRDAECELLAEGLRNNRFPSLRRLSIEHEPPTHITGKGIKALMEAGTVEKPLEMEDLGLALTYAAGQEEGTAAIAKALGEGRLPKLRKLDLRTTGMKDPGMKNLAGALLMNDLPSLRHVLLSFNAATEAGHTAFLESIMQAPSWGTKQAACGSWQEAFG